MRYVIYLCQVDLYFNHLAMSHGRAVVVRWLYDVRGVSGIT